MGYRLYGVSTIYYFGGIEIQEFPFDYQKSDSVNTRELEEYFILEINQNTELTNKMCVKSLEVHLKRTRFFLMLQNFGYKLILKPVKSFFHRGEVVTRKANCDVDLAFLLMRDIDTYDRAIVLSGDGDFLPVLKFLRDSKKEVVILSRGPRTAKEIRKFAGGEFRDFEYLRTYIEFERKNNV